MGSEENAYGALALDGVYKERVADVGLANEHVKKLNEMDSLLSGSMDVERCGMTGYSRIVNFSSVAGPVVSNPGETTYGAAKAAMVCMSCGLAMEVAKYNITATNVAPGWIGTNRKR